jgi:tetratricopeptide (TPR) repeat protein
VTVERRRFFGNLRVAIQSAHRFAPIPLTAAVLIAALVAAGCSKEKRAVAEIRHSYEAHEYEETVALCRHATRLGMETPDVDYYHGASLVALGRDFEGFRKLQEAAQGDPSLSREIGPLLYEMGEKSFRDGSRTKAAKRMRTGVEIDPSLELGSYVYLVADEYYEEKDYETAAAMYARAVESFPDTTAAEEAYFNMAAAYLEIGSPSRARESLDRLLELYPRGTLAKHARWRLVNILYEEGEKNYLLGNYDEVIEVIGELLSRTRNPGIVQKSRFLLGETYEALGEFDRAYAQYKEIIEEDRGASGRIVERARGKIAALREAGLY